MRIMSLGVLLTFLLAGLALASGGSAKMSPQEALKEVIQHNDRFVREHKAEDFSAYQTAQHPILTLVTCSDARVQTEALLPEAIDRVFVIRNIGNQVGNSQGSVDYGILHLHTPILLILGHTHCGAVKAAMGDYSGETPGIIAELDHLHLPLSQGPKEGDFEKRWLQNVEENVHYQVKQALRAYKEKVAHGELVIVGAVYDFINAYGKGFGRVVIIDVNGEKDSAKIRAHQVMSLLSENLKAVCTK